MRLTRTHLFSVSSSLLFAAALHACNDAGPMEVAASTSSPETARVAAKRSFPVSGDAIHYFTTSIEHSSVPKEGGLVARTTDIIQLSGDLSGYLLYHPTSVIDFAAGTLVNTGTQFFSGTVAGSDPVILHDDEFRFDVVFDPPSTVGTVHLGRSLDAPLKGGWFECDLDVAGAGLTPEGDGLATYSGTCTEYGSMN